MAIAYDTSSTTNAVNPGTSLTWAHTCTGDNRILFVCARNGHAEGERITGITYDGVAMTKIDSYTVGSGEPTIVLYYLVAPSIGSDNIVVSSSSGYIQAAAASYTGASQANIPDSKAEGGVLNTSSYSLSTTTVADNCWLVMAACGSLIGKTMAAGTTKRQDQVYDSNGAKTSAGSYSLGFTGGDAETDVSCVIASFAPAIPTSGSLFFAQL